MTLPRVRHLDVGREVRSALVPRVAPVGHDPTRLDRPAPVDLAADRSAEPAATKRRSARTHEISSWMLLGPNRRMAVADSARPRTHLRRYPLRRGGARRTRSDAPIRTPG